ncbi:hypothetical protein WA026_019665 [Henosepilachna vigintioctopunctata]|uniref:Uncharacterized protein n=1 Tax=Henosepilachna vigintioctopunctata TaxID=420089 RepID=A0AAW1ULQ7_9CUCU
MKRCESKNEKDLKQLKNMELKKPKNTRSEKLKAQENSRNSEDTNSDSEESSSFERIRELFKKTEEMKEIAKEKNQEVESQFENLRERLNGSSLFLNQMKSSIENLRFSYQRKMMEQNDQDFENYLKNKEKFKSKEEINSYMDQLKEKIQNLQTKPKVSEFEENEPKDYQSALKDVVKNLKIIDDGLYSSGKHFGKE